EILAILKSINASIPTVLVTKNEAEHLMEDAIGSQIDDYLIKPVNPKQILLTIKKLTENRRLVSEKTSMAYQQDFLKLGMRMNENLSYQEWVETYKKIVYWELALQKIEDDSMHRSEEHTSELQSRFDLVCRLLLEKKK